MQGNTTTLENPARPSRETPVSHASLTDRLTIVTTYYMIPSAPRMTVLETTIKRLRKNMAVEGCRHLVYYHEPEGGGPRAAKHLDNLRRLCDRYGLELYVRPDSGIKINLIEALQTVTTPYMLFLEYDLALRKKIDLAKLVSVFDKYDFVNYVLFNTEWNNSLRGWGHLVAPEDRIPEVPLTRTSCWSNQAHLVRVSKWHEEWLGIIGTDRPSGPMYGVEDTLYWVYNRAIFTEGFFEAQAKWGVYYYGGVNDGPTLYHINGAGNLGTPLEYLNKAKRFAKRTVTRLRG